MAAEDDRAPVRASEYLVHQGELQLAVAGAAEVRAEVAGPQPALAHLLLQRGDQPLPRRVGHVVAVRDEVIDRLYLVAHEAVHPVELRLEFRLGFKVPAHESSPRVSAAVGGHGRRVPRPGPRGWPSARRPFPRAGSGRAAAAARSPSSSRRRPGTSRCRRGRGRSRRRRRRGSPGWAGRPSALLAVRVHPPVVMRVGGIRPVVEQDPDVHQGIPERRHVPVEHRVHPVGVGGIELAVVQLEIVVQDRGALRRRGGSAQACPRPPA